MGVPAPQPPPRQMLEQEQHSPSSVRQPSSSQRFPLGSAVFAAWLSLCRPLNKYCDRPAPCLPGRQRHSAVTKGGP